jgi:hypothetical protein
MHGNAYEAEFTLYPDPKGSERFRSRGSYIGQQMSDYGVDSILDETREQLSKEPIREWLTSVRVLFDEGYGSATRLGEAFEDGAVTGLLIGSDVINSRVLPLLTDKVGTLIEAYEEEYFGQARETDVLFSEPRMKLIEAIRKEGTKGYMEFRAHISPLASQITVEKYPQHVRYVHAISQGIGFVLGQLKWAHHDDFTQFASKYTETQSTFATRETIRHDIARQAMDYLNLQPRSQT